MGLPVRCLLLSTVLTSAPLPMVAVGVEGGRSPSRTDTADQWAVHVPGGEHRATRVAARHHCHLISQVGSLEDFYLFECGHPLRRRSARRARRHLRRMKRSPEIRWVEQQYAKGRPKRDTGFLSSLFGSLFDEDPVPARSRPTASPTTDARPGLSTPPADLLWSDPLFQDQWYFEEGNMTMHVQPAWRRGYTGRGVAVTILDDGIQINHPDLQDNYDPLASTDVNSLDGDPSPHDDGRGTNRHGTRNAGVVAAAADNRHCGVGVAPRANIGGVRMLDGDVTDAVEARALSHNPQHVDVYSASWGPDDDGRTLEAPGLLATRAFIHGILRGRDGKGSIFVWASGNGGSNGDDCNCDGYNGNIFTISISSATENGRKPWYLEECASTLATTYSSGSREERAVITSDLDSLLRPERLCTSRHTGTSASTALAAGVCALALEANPALTWRDMQHLIVRTSNPAPLASEPGWRTNAGGRNVSHKFGYGLMDALAMVKLAERWITAPEQLICITPPDDQIRTIPAAAAAGGGSVSATMNVTACRNTGDKDVHYVEHVQCRVTLHHPRRGSLRITLTSPAGTESTLLHPRARDYDSQQGFREWPFLSVHFWGEDPAGQWTLTATSEDPGDPAGVGELMQWQLAFFGTREDPYRPRPPQ